MARSIAYGLTNAADLTKAQRVVLVIVVIVVTAYICVPNVRGKTVVKCHFV